jgi:YbbR domain-containing protein
MKFLRWLSGNLRALLWAFALAVAVWVAAVTSADPDESRSLPTPVPLELVGQDPRLVVNSELPSTVEIVLRAPRSLWLELETDARMVRAILDLSRLTAGEHQVELQIQVDMRPVRIVSVAPASVAIRLEPLAERTFEVDLNQLGQLGVGYQAGEPVVQPGTATASGAQSVVDRVDRLQVSVDLDGIRETVDEDLLVQPLNSQGQPIASLTVAPATVHVRLPISQQGGYRDMAVKVVTRGVPASGYRLTDISVFPPVITVYSSQPELINLLPAFLETQPLDLADAEDDISTRLGLSLPPGVSVVGEQTVLIQAGVSPIESSITLADEKVTLLGLTSGLNAEVSPASVDVIVSGPLALLYTLTPQDVRVSVDMTGLGPGTYQETATVDILIADVVVESVLPATIQVVLTTSATPTLTPSP